MIARIAVLAFGTVTFCLVVADVVLIARPWTTALPYHYGLRGIGAILGVVLTIVGAAIAIRHPRNTVGWIFLVSGVFAPLLDVGTGLRDDVELDSVRADLLEVVNSTVHPAHASVWLRGER